jgi:hypothetical protein
MKRSIYGHEKTRKKNTRKRNSGFSESDLRVTAYIATLILAGYLIYNRSQSPAAWGGLGVAIGALFQQSVRSIK